MLSVVHHDVSVAHQIVDCGWVSQVRLLSEVFGKVLLSSDHIGRRSVEELPGLEDER